MKAPIYMETMSPQDNRTLKLAAFNLKPYLKPKYRVIPYPFFRLPSFMVRISYIEKYRYLKKG